MRVSLVASNPVVRAGLEAMLRSMGFDLVDANGVAGDELAGVDVIVSADADADVADLSRGRESPPVVLIGAEVTSEALEAGVRAVLPGNCTADELSAAIHAAAAGLVAFPAVQVSTLLDGGIPETDAGGVLSPRELQVLQMMSEGLANKEIAWRLGISEHTVKFHVASILNRLDASTRTQAVAIGLRRGMIML